MPISEKNQRVTITMKKENVKALEYMSLRLGVTKASVINIALHEFINKNFPEIKLLNSPEDFENYKRALEKLK
jgi:predicted DNA-binding protein